MFLEVSKALKSNNFLLSETSDEKKVLHEVAHPFCCVCFNQQNLFPEGSGGGGNR